MNSHEQTGFNSHHHWVSEFWSGDVGLTLVSVTLSVIILIFVITPLLHELGSVFSTITLLLYVRSVLLVMFRSGRITWSRIQGGVCAYLLLGMAWASAFQLVEQLLPGSFHFATIPKSMDQLSSRLTYFSLGTLTTLGSDIIPLNPFARSLTTAEGIVGQLFPAILIGALVAMAMESKGSKR